MNIAIVTNMNGIGLQRDYELLAEELRSRGHDVTGVQFDEELSAKDLLFDLAIFLEVVPRDKLPLAFRRWLFANPEWVKPDMVPTVRKFFEKVFAKTHEGERILGELFPGKVHYTGFLTRDQYDETVKRHPWFLHIGGNSSLRGTQATIDAWRWKKDGRGIDATLHIVSRALKERPEIPGVIYHEELTEEKIKNLQNQCLFHIYPSGTEGWGHALREALSVGARVLTTAGPPMDEIDNCYQVEPCGTSSYNYATVYEVSALAIRQNCELLLLLEQTNVFPYKPREEFLAGNESFRKSFAAHLDEFSFRKRPGGRVASGSKQKDIVYIGNFLAPESTENMVLWALERLGHTVWRVQENDCMDSGILTELAMGSDLLLWTRTPGAFKVPDEQMQQVLRDIQRFGTQTASLHLDKFWGIPAREAEVGKTAFWKTQYVFTADGSRQIDFLERGVNHIWMKPAVSEVYCHPGIPRDGFKCDVGFVGARDYHSEYPFRRELVDFLEKRYDSRFKHITGVRGHDLNDFYASCKVVVGDCIFAGTPRYWSDRVPETCGRYGFLLHPIVDGLDPSTPLYVPQNLDSVKQEIDRWLNLGLERDITRLIIAEEVAKKHTWTVRMSEILAQVFDGTPMH